MAILTGVHWLAPTIMTSSLAAAIALALGHHFFYHSLNGDEVASGTYNIAENHLSKQQFNTALGTAFAFLVRLLLGIANSAAYVQLFWLSARYARTPTINELDWANTLISDFFKLFYVHRGWKFPSLLLAAVVLWCTPIATIFPPATLVVDNVQQNSSALLEVPNLDFTTFAYSADMYPGLLNNSEIWTYRGTSQPIQNLASAVAASGRGLIPNFYPAAPTDAANATWTFEDFFSPAISCREVTGEQRGDIWMNIWNAYNWTTTDAPVYLSWTPWSEHDAVIAGFNVTAGRFNYQHCDLPYFSNGSGLAGPSDSPVSTDGPASFFVAVMPGAQSISIAPGYDGPGVFILPSDATRPDISPVVLPGGCPFSAMENFNQSLTLDCDPPIIPAEIFTQASLSRCDLMNVSTSIGFDYSNITAPVRLLAFDNTGDDYLSGSQYFLGPDEFTGYLNSTQLAGETCIPFISDPLAIEGDQNASDQESLELKEPLCTSCEFDPQSLRLLSYQSIMAAFFHTFRGYIDSARNVQTKVVDTTFMDTNELNWLWAYIVNTNVDEHFRLSRFFDIIPAAKKYRATAAPTIEADQGWLMPAMGEAFQRLVLSLLSDPYFHPNYDSIFAPPRLTNVTSRGYHNVYVYDAFTLGISYGIAVLFTTGAVAAGWVAICLNKCSCSNDFSTFVRVGRLAHIDTDVKHEDGSGADPLPKYLEKARIDIGSLGTSRTRSTSSAESQVNRKPEAVPLVNGSDNASHGTDEARGAVVLDPEPHHERGDSGVPAQQASGSQSIPTGQQAPASQQVPAGQQYHAIPMRQQAPASQQAPTSQQTQPILPPGQQARAPQQAPPGQQNPAVPRRAAPSRPRPGP